MVDEDKHEDERQHGEPPDAPTAQRDELDTASKSLSDALRISFAILKVIMVILVVAFLASGFRTVESGEEALVLRFGRIQRVVGPGFEWVFPYPIDEVVKIPVENQVTLRINSFWYKEGREDILGEGAKPRRYFPDKLNPVSEGYCLTRSQEKGTRPFSLDATIATEDTLETATPQARAGGASESTLIEAVEGSDYNIVHSRWEIIYQIGDVERFFKSVHMRDVLPGQVYFDVMRESLTPLLRSVVEDAVVDALVHYSIDEALQSIDTIPRHVRRLVQEKLDAMGSGIAVTSVQLVEVAWPKQVDEAFQEYVKASQERGKAVSNARSYAQTTLNQAVGRVAESLHRALKDETVDPEQLERLWAQVGGQAQDEIAQAQTYRAKVAASAEANANYLLSLLPEYEKRPELVAQEVYLDTIEQVLQNADEKFIIERADNAKGHEIRVLLNRDPKLKPKQTSSAETTN